MRKGAAAESSAWHPHPWRVFAATSIGVVAVFVSMSGLTVALPTLTRDLHASAIQVTWILLGYMLVTTALILVFGRLADIIGRRSLYLGGLAVFTAATALCVVAPSAEWLIVARLLQGVGAAAIITNNTALLTDTFPPQRLGRVLGWNATVAALAQVLGPVIGGLATSLIGWRGLFFAALAFAVIATIASLWVIPRSAPISGARERFDVPGAFLSTLLLTIIVFALTPGLGDGYRMVWVYLAGGLLVAVVFIIVQIRREDPLIDLSLLRDRGIALVLAAALLIAVSSYAVALIISLFVQAVDGVSPSVAGLMVTPVAVGTVISAVIAGSLVGRFTARTLTVAGMASTTLGLLALTLLLAPTGTSIPLTMAALFTVGCGIGLFMTPSTSALMLTVTADRRGIANGIRSTLQNVGNLLSTAIVLAVVPIGLGSGARHAAYSGTPQALTPAELARFVGNLQLAGTLLTVTAAVGIVVCLAFPRTRIPPVPVSLPIPPATLPPLKETA